MADAEAQTAAAGVRALHGAADSDADDPSPAGAHEMASAIASRFAARMEELDTRERALRPREAALNEAEVRTQRDADAVKAQAASVATAAERVERERAATAAEKLRLKGEAEELERQQRALAARASEFEAQERMLGKARTKLAIDISQVRESRRRRARVPAQACARRWRRGWASASSVRARRGRRTSSWRRSSAG